MYVCAARYAKIDKIDCDIVILNIFYARDNFFSKTFGLYICVHRAL